MYSAAVLLTRWGSLRLTPNKMCPYTCMFTIDTVGVVSLCKTVWHYFAIPRRKCVLIYNYAYNTKMEGLIVLTQLCSLVRVWMKATASAIYAVLHCGWCNIHILHCGL